MRLVAMAVVTALALAACSPGNEGWLVPEPAVGVTIDQRKGATIAAEIRDSDLTVRVGGTWASQGHQALDLTYRNTGPVPQRVALASLGITLRGETAMLDTLDDVTGVDVSKPGNTAVPRALIAGTAPPSLVIPPGEARVVLARFANFRADPRIGVGDTVEITVPLATTSRRLVFTAERVVLP